MDNIVFVIDGKTLLPLAEPADVIEGTASAGKPPGVGDGPSVRPVARP
ncbi:MAG TPA: hypothetical protein VF206_06360 [Rubrobacter sp.]